METAKTAETLDGDKLYQMRARIALRILVRQAIARRPITYSDLAAEIGMENPRNLNYVLGSIGETLIELQAKWGIEIPLINCLVINKNTGLPGEGIDGFIGSGNEFKNLPKRKQRILIDEIAKGVFKFDRWSEVLSALGLEQVKPIDYPELIKQSNSRFGEGSGESEFHKKLKEFVSKSIQILDLPKDTSRGIAEYLLPSGDVVDVMFITKTDWVAVEVKSRISNLEDIRRGLYQCIKYEAVVEALHSEMGLLPSCRAVLVLESEFPLELKPLKNLLGVEVIDNVQVG